MGRKRGRERQGGEQGREGAGRCQPSSSALEAASGPQTAELRPLLGGTSERQSVSQAGHRLRSRTCAFQSHTDAWTCRRRATQALWF